jgi:hypothetical protein
MTIETPTDEELARLGAAYRSWVNGTGAVGPSETVTMESGRRLSWQLDVRRVYGVPMLGQIGDDGEYLVALGHVEQQRFVAACQGYAREWVLDPGQRRLFADHDDVLTWNYPLVSALERTEHRMARLDPHPDTKWVLLWGESLPGRDVPVTVLDWSA